MSSDGSRGSLHRSDWGGSDLHARFLPAAFFFEAGFEALAGGATRDTFLPAAFFFEAGFEALAGGATRDTFLPAAFLPAAFFFEAGFEALAGGAPAAFLPAAFLPAACLVLPTYEKCSRTGDHGRFLS